MRYNLGSAESIEKSMNNTIFSGDCLHILKTLPAQSVDCCVTSPPYFGLRDYGSIPEQIGQEKTVTEYVNRLVAVFGEVRRVLSDNGSLWLNLGDCYSGSGKGRNVDGSINAKGKQAASKGSIAGTLYKTSDEQFKKKNLMGIPWRIALALQDDDWYLRQDIIWAKRNPMPESTKDRFCRSHEYLFLLTKNPKYYFNHDEALEEATGYDGRGIDAVYKNSDYEQTVHNFTAGTKRKRWAQRGYVSKDGTTGLSAQFHGKNIPTRPLRTKRDVWFLSTEPSKEKHYAMFPQKLIEPCIRCGCPEGGIVLDPFMGSGTTAIVAVKNNRRYLGCEINDEYIKIAEKRIMENKTLFDFDFEKDQER